MSCVLRVQGDFFDIDALLSNVELIPVAIWKKGQKRFSKGQLHINSGANFVVSDADIEDFPAQIAEAESYLAKNYDEIMKLTSAAGVSDAVLDFAVATRPGFVTQTSNFTVAFLGHMAKLKLALAVSHYPIEHDIEK